MIEPVISRINEKKLIGLSCTMSLVNNKTSDLWRLFMARRKEISNAVNKDLISLQLYDSDYFKQFNPENSFKKWAALEVPDFSNVPEGMETLTSPAGTYAIFHYKGSSADSSIYQYIFSEWLPKSSYQLNNRPHFEVLGEKYKNNDDSSEEVIYIPIK